MISCVLVFPQAIQPGDHYKALLGRKVSVCVHGSEYVCSYVHPPPPPQMYGITMSLQERDKGIEHWEKKHVQKGEDALGI